MVSLEISDTKAKLYSLTTIVGRAIVVHEGMDDLGIYEDRGSKTTGNAGESFLINATLQTASGTLLMTRLINMTHYLRF